jgi:hypothetical protein
LSGETWKPEHCVALPGGKKELSAEYKPSNEHAYDRADNAQAQDEPHRGALTVWRASVGESLFFIPQEFPNYRISFERCSRLKPLGLACNPLKS